MMMSDDVLDYLHNYKNIALSRYIRYWFNVQAYYAQHIKTWSVRTRILPSYCTQEQSADMTLEATSISISS